MLSQSIWFSSFWPCSVFLTQPHPLRLSVKLLVIYCKIRFSQRSLCDHFPPVGHECEGMQGVLLSQGRPCPRTVCAQRLGWKTACVGVPAPCSRERAFCVGRTAVGCLHQKCLHGVRHSSSFCEDTFRGEALFFLLVSFPPGRMQRQMPSEEELLI